MYRILISKSARKTVKKKLSKTATKRIYKKIEELKEEPRPRGCRKVVGEGLWRVRVGDYRIIYTVDDEKKQVAIYRIAHRREAYR